MSWKGKGREKREFRIWQICINMKIYLLRIQNGLKVIRVFRTTLHSALRSNQITIIFMSTYYAPDTELNPCHYSHLFLTTTLRNEGGTISLYG